MMERGPIRMTPEVRAKLLKRPPTQAEIDERLNKRLADRDLVQRLDALQPAFVHAVRNVKYLRKQGHSPHDALRMAVYELLRGYESPTMREIFTPEEDE